MRKQQRNRRMIIEDLAGDEIEISLKINRDGKQRLWICNTETDIDTGEEWSQATLFNPSDIDKIIEALQEIKRSV